MKMRRPLQNPRSLLVGAFCRPAGRPGLERLVQAEQEQPAATDGHLVALVQAGPRHLVAVDHDVLGIGRGLDPVPSFLPADPPLHGGNACAGEDDIAGDARAEKHGVVARQLDELNPPLAVVNFQGGHARTVSSGCEKGRRSADAAAGYRSESRLTRSLESPQRLLGDDLEAVAVVVGDHPEPGYPDLAGLAASIAHFELGELLLDAPGVELKHHSLAERDPRLVNQGHVRGLAPSALPEEIEAAVTPARSVPLGRLAAG